MHAPDSALVGEHHGVVSQIDIMPTLLGLLGNEESYFAFGRDIFNEQGSMPMAVNYDNNMFQVITEQDLIIFDEKQVVGVYSVDDVAHEKNRVSQRDVRDVENRLKALIQSYYTRVENKDYLVDDNTVSQGGVE